MGSKKLNTCHAAGGRHVCYSGVGCSYQQQQLLLRLEQVEHHVYINRPIRYMCVYTHHFISTSTLYKRAHPYKTVSPAWLEHTGPEGSQR
jgi:hypothetical protein